MNVNVVKVTFDRLTNKINFSVSLLNQCLHAHVPLHVQQFYFTVAQVTATKHIESAGKKKIIDLDTCRDLAHFPPSHESMLDHSARITVLLTHTDTHMWSCAVLHLVIVKVIALWMQYGWSITDHCPWALQTCCCFRFIPSVRYLPLGRWECVFVGERQANDKWG